jgi:hypothetical protein
MSAAICGTHRPPHVAALMRATATTATSSCALSPRGDTPGYHQDTPSGAAFSPRPPEFRDTLPPGGERLVIGGYRSPCLVERDLVGAFRRSNRWHLLQRALNITQSSVARCARRRGRAGRRRCHTYQRLMMRVQLRSVSSSPARVESSSSSVSFRSMRRVPRSRGAFSASGVLAVSPRRQTRGERRGAGAGTPLVATSRSDDLRFAGDHRP